jgi:putative methionine-R-sulfoxide reductase with GAF domain
MSTDPSLDQESFQTFLANAYLVQQSGIGVHSLSAFIKIQRSIAVGESDVDEAMRLVADATRDVANATGVAIALLEANQLVYRAVSGSATTNIGRRVTAVLSVSTHDVRREIVKVEDAQADSRIEAEICRQFGDKSLLILPICREHTLVGVLEIHFSEVHSFQDREVRTYRLMAGLIEEAMLGNAPSGDKKAGDQKTSAMLPATVSHAVEQMASFYNNTSAPGEASTPPSTKGALFSNKFSFANLSRNAATAAGVSALVIAGWLAYSHHPRISAAGSEAPRSNAAVQDASSTFFKPLPTDHLLQAHKSAGTQRRFARSNAEGPLSGFERIRVGNNEVDYVTDDVTVRLFTPAPPKSQAQQWKRQVNFGDDVTVRYFADKPAVPQPTPVSAAAQAAERSLPVSK